MSDEIDIFRFKIINQFKMNLTLIVKIEKKLVLYNNYCIHSETK